MFDQRNFPDFIALGFMTEVLEEIAQHDKCSAPSKFAGDEKKHAVEGAGHADNVQTSIDWVLVPAYIVDNKLSGIHHLRATASFCAPLRSDLKYSNVFAIPSLKGVRST